ncbi:hypothetical protein [Methanosarcina sp. UBA5]|uniref:hypothetical protein n=1 Tax=Methanosarcina sp. UBA5 TaxID=1915593 RepID=UPI0025D6AD3D|nr:hypothetical protein [Methanosarcina sp. UBA5]
MRIILKYGLFLLGAFSLLTLNALALSDPSNDNMKLENNSLQDNITPTNKSDEPITFGMDVNFIHYTHEELSNYSDTIVIGTVKEILPPKWNTMDGKQPNKPLTEIDRLNDTIYTDIVIGVDEYLKNPLSSKEVIVRSTVGTIGNVSMTSDAEPSFKTGEKVLLYLSKDDNPATKDVGPEHFIVTDFFEGKFTLTDDGKAIGFVENTTLKELLSTINQTDNKANDTGISNDTETASKQEQNSSSTPESKRIPFISSVWVFAVVLGAVIFRRKTKQ